MLVFHKLYRTAQSVRAHRTESVSVMGHELTIAASSKRSLDQKQRNIVDSKSAAFAVHQLGDRVATARMHYRQAGARCTLLPTHGAILN